MKMLERKQSAFAQEDLELIEFYARGKRFLIETGSGESTHYIFHGMPLNAKFYTINRDDIHKENHIPRVKYLVGWSISFEDFDRPGDPDFIQHSHYYELEERIIKKNDRRAMYGQTDLLRWILKKEKNKVDFFFCDTGEYCGWPEWKIMKDHIATGGFVLLHDYKKYKNRRTADYLAKSDNWDILKATDSTSNTAACDCCSNAQSSSDRSPQNVQ